MFDRFDHPLNSTCVQKDILTRLIAAARVAGPVTWGQAEAEAAHDVADLWGDRTPAEQTHVEVSTEVLLQLAAAAATAVAAVAAAGAQHAGAQHAGAGWADRVAGDLLEIQSLTGAAG